MSSLYVLGSGIFYGTSTVYQALLPGLIRTVCPKVALNSQKQIENDIIHSENTFLSYPQHVLSIMIRQEASYCPENFMRFSPCLLGLCQSDLSRVLFSPINTACLLSLTIAGKANTAKEPTGLKRSNSSKALQILF